MKKYIILVLFCITSNLVRPTPFRFAKHPARAGIGFAKVSQKVQQNHRTKARTTKHKKVVTQGINGIVLWQSGNQMPSPDAPATTSKGRPVQREVYIYELTNQKQTDASAMPFFSKLSTKLIAKVQTGKDGKFKIKLPVGYYSVFTKEEKGLYANQFDDSMNIFTVHVTRNKWLDITFLIDYQAAY